MDERIAKLALADGSGGTETVTMNYAQLQQEYLGLQRRRVELQKERAEVLAPATGLRATRDALTKIHDIIINMKKHEKMKIMLFEMNSLWSEHLHEH